MITYGSLDFSQVNDPIKTEETIYHQLARIDLPIEYVGIPIAFSINTLGIDQTQSMIDEINRVHPQEKFFVCQHIFVNRLNFGESKVFTPHTCDSDRYYFIPHYNPIYDSKPEVTEFDDRTYTFSFMGDFQTNEARQVLSRLHSKSTPIIPTGKWFFSHEEDKQKELKKLYLNYLRNTKYSLCPPGTGPSTLRLFESMSVGSIPIVFNDIKIPRELNGLIIKTDIDSFLQNPNSIFERTQNGGQISSNIYNTYWENFSNERLADSIIKHFK